MKNPSDKIEIIMAKRRKLRAANNAALGKLRDADEKILQRITKINADLDALRNKKMAPLVKKQRALAAKSDKLVAKADQADAVLLRKIITLATGAGLNLGAYLRITTDNQPPTT